MDLTRTSRIGAIASLAAILCSPAILARELSFEERVKAQEAIERVYYSHQIGATRPFEQAVPRSVLETKVETYLKQSVALEKIWGTPVTSEALRREMERMASRTRMPERLRQLFGALGNDAFLVQECLARATLVDRLSRDFFANDSRIHAETRRRADALHDELASGLIDPLADHPRRSVIELVRVDEDVGAKKPEGMHEGEAGGSRRIALDLTPEEYLEIRGQFPRGGRRLAAVRQEPDYFVVRVALFEDADRLTVASYRIAKRSWDEWWRDAEGDLEEDRVEPVAAQAPLTESHPSSEASTSSCLPDNTWDEGYSRPPETRSTAAAVWTGSEMIVWGGEQGTEFLNSGGRYDPATDTWRSTTTVEAPSGRQRHTAVWSGTEMIVWGGIGDTGRHRTGGRYDPATNTWSALDWVGVGAPTARDGHSAIWTGSRMIVWGGKVSDTAVAQTGGQYDPVANSWTQTSTVAAPVARVDHTAVWTGSRMVVWGGWSPVFGYLRNGRRYDPVANTWENMTDAGTPAARSLHTAVWTGTQMVVWGGNNGSRLATGGRYDPLTDAWTPTSGTGAPAARDAHTAIWTGSVMVVWGGYASQPIGGTATGGRYDPVADTWAPTSITSAPLPRQYHVAVWTGSRMVVWGGGTDTGGRYDPMADAWTPTATANGPPGIWYHQAIWTGSEMIVWGGQSTSGCERSGGRYDPATDRWIPTTQDGAPTLCYPLAVWTGVEMIVWGGRGGRYDPLRDRWTQVTTAGAPAVYSSAAWTGAEMIVWGGYFGGGSAGGRYDPETDSWMPMSLTNAPSGRGVHTTVWTGTEMVIWGGYNGPSGPLNTGGRYDPAQDSWKPTATENAPSVRGDHTAVWTGSAMIVWGGWDYQSVPYPIGDGKLYDPSTDSWFGYFNSGSFGPASRHLHTAAWTGTRMVVWGGRDRFNDLRSGGAYDPSSRSWINTPEVEAPSPRRGHTAVWTGTFMIVWGGGSRTGGRYVLEQNVDNDGDGASECGGDCNDSNPAVFPGAAEVCNKVDDDCDGAIDEDAEGVDTDADLVPNACDNCRHDANPSQGDEDSDGEGDVCDLDDGLVFEFRDDRTSIRWQPEQGGDSWNVYEGYLAVLRSAGVYTQAPGSNPLADRHCGILDTVLGDPEMPGAGQAAFSLVTSVQGGVEGSLGTDSAGQERANANPCP